MPDTGCQIKTKFLILPASWIWHPESSCFMKIHRQHFETIDSTHLYLMREGKKLPEGTLITADFQERGKGRLNRKWIASHGSSLLASLLLKPEIDAAHTPQLTHVIALAGARTLRNGGLDIAIRWPNDIVCRGKKIAGILAQSSITGNRVDFAVLSLGINLNQEQNELDEIDRPATSCAMETGHAWNADKLLEDILEELKPLYLKYIANGFAALKKEWESLNYLKGRAITVGLDGRTIEGIVDGVDDDARLVLLTENGIQTFSSGEVIRVSGEKL
jgi:BirA family biotin operon repressor/biotin-[acetyl-CoA-carboxylase] ligase